MSELIDLIQTESVGVVEESIYFLLYECSIDEAPTVKEVNEWIDLLNIRGGKFIRLARMCQTWLEEEVHS